MGVATAAPAVAAPAEGMIQGADAEGAVKDSYIVTYCGDLVVDLVVDLVAPDGSTYRLKSSSTSDSADNVDATYPVDASSETTVNGTWQLKVQDVYSADTVTSTAGS